jgi:hypothetical protein
VAYQTVGGTGDVDYTNGSGWLVWDDGDVADKMIEIPVVNDLAIEGTEALMVTAAPR